MWKFANTKLILPILLVFFLQWSAAGLELVLREQVQVNGSVVRLGDLADLSLEAGEASDLAETVLMPAPAAGTRQFLQDTEIRDLLTTQGVEVDRLDLRGAKMVELSSEVASPHALGDKPFAGMDETKLAVEQAVQQRLVSQADHPTWRVELDLQERDARRIAALGDDFVVDGGRRPWTGSQTFVLRSRSGANAVEVRATVSKTFFVVVARRAIQRGRLIRRSDVEIREQVGSVPALAMKEIEPVVGMLASRNIAADSMIQQGYVKAPLLVKRGEAVTVFARTGGVTVRTMALARQDGAMGELIQVESMDDKKRFMASVTGTRRLEVYPTGAQVEDFAMLRSSQGKQR